MFGLGEMSRDRSRALSIVYGLEREPVDPLPSSESCQTLLCRRQPLCRGGHRFGVHVIRLDPRPGVGLIVTGPIRHALLVLDFDLQSLVGIVERQWVE